jgi:hypothetical protein
VALLRGLWDDEEELDLNNDFHELRAGGRQGIGRETVHHVSSVYKHYPNNKRIKERAVIHDAAVKWAKRARRKKDFCRAPRPFQACDLLTTALGKVFPACTASAA